jgi:hypothetical protein
MFRFKRYNYGTSKVWSNGVDLFDGFLTTNFYDGAMPNINGVYTFMIKAIDTSLNYSITPATIVMHLGDAKIDNLIETYDFSSWSGTKTNCEVLNGELVANNLLGLMYQNDDIDLFYDRPGSDIFYDGSYAQMSYIDKFTATATAKAVLRYTGSSDAKFYYRKPYDSPFYNYEDKMYYKNDTDLFYDDANIFTNYIDGFDVKYGDNIEVKAEFPQTSAQTVMTSFKAIIDAKDYTEKINDYTIPQGGITYISSEIDIIKNVQATLQGGTGVNFKYTKNNNQISMNVYDLSGSDVGGLCDLILTGYKI